METYITCPSCKGSTLANGIAGAQNCAECNGEGVIRNRTADGRFSRGNTEPTEVRSAEGSLPTSPTSIEDLDKRKKLISSLRHSPAFSAAIGLYADPTALVDWLMAYVEAERIAGAVEELERLKLQEIRVEDLAGNGMGIGRIPIEAVDARLAELEGEK